MVQSIQQDVQKWHNLDRLATSSVFIRLYEQDNDFLNRLTYKDTYKLIRA